MSLMRFVPWNRHQTYCRYHMFAMKSPNVVLFSANVFSYCSRFFWNPFIPGLLKVHLVLFVRFGWYCLYSFALCCLYCFGWFCNVLHVNRLTFDFIFAYRCLHYMYFLWWFVHFALCVRCFMSWILQGMRMTGNKAFKMFSTTLRILGTKKSQKSAGTCLWRPLPPQKKVKFQEEPRNWGHSKNIHVSQRGTDEIDVCAYVAGCQYPKLYSMVKCSYPKCLVQWIREIQKELLNSCVSTRIFWIFFASWHDIMIPRHLILDWNNEKLWQFAVTSSTYNYWDVFQKPLGRSQKLEVETSPPGVGFQSSNQTSPPVWGSLRFKHIKCTTERMRNDIQPSEGEDLVMEHTKTAWSGEKIAPDFGGGGLEALPTKTS